MDNGHRYRFFSILTLLLVFSIVCDAAPYYTVVFRSTDTLSINNKRIGKILIDTERTSTPYLLNNNLLSQGLAPAFFMTSSFLVWGNRGDIKKVRDRYVPSFSNHLDDYLQYAPAVSVIGLNLAGKKGLNGWKRQTVNWGTSMIIMGALVNSIKYTTKVVRPDGTTSNSFPSGHTATAFMNATFLHKEYGHISPFYSIAGYTSSSYVGVSRSLNNRHWISDILAGAAIGIISTELSYVIVDHFYKNKGDYFSNFTVQEEIDKPSYLSARMGYSFDITDGSFSALGVESTIEGSYYFNKKWGIMGEAIFANYPFRIGKGEVDDLELADIILKNPQQDLQSMGLFYFMAGPQYTKMIGSKFLLHLKATAGITVGSKGEVSLYGVAENKENGMQSTITLPFIDYKSRNSFVAGTGISITAMMTPKIGLTWFTDYKYSQLTFDVVPSKKTFGNQLDYIHEQESISLNNLSSGLRLTAFFD